MTPLSSYIEALIGVSARGWNSYTVVSIWYLEMGCHLAQQSKLR